MRFAITLVLGLCAASVFAKLPAPPPKAPEVVEAEKAKAAEAAKKGAELQAKYEDRAVANHAAKAKAEGKPFNPLMAPGLPSAPAAVPAAAPATAAAKPPAPAPAKK